MTYQFTISGHADYPKYPQGNPEEAERSFQREHDAVEAALAAAEAVLKSHGLLVTNAHGTAMKGELRRLSIGNR